jgi:outer membrane protein assembly factor BamE (lipoprotein component of BamABCDE complex)
MMIGARLAVLAAAAILAGCAVGRLEPGRSTEADVRAALGEPARVYPVPDGTRMLAFPQGPAGTQTYMAHVTADGRLTRFEQVLSNDQFRRIERGTTTGAQLERLIGPPWRVMDFPNKKQVAWDYVFQDEWGYVVDFSVMLDERGIVAETAYARRESGRDGGYK